MPTESRLFFGNGYSKPSPKRRALSDLYLAKFEKMMVKDHSLGKDDTQKAPCPLWRGSISIRPVAKRGRNESPYARAGQLGKPWKTRGPRRGRRLK
jgi:hypothetical protein